MVMASAPSPQQVGREFVRQYYTMLHENPDMLHRFYSSGSTFIHGGVDRPGQVEEPLIGQVEINKKIQQLSFKDCHTKIRQVDSQATIASAVVVQVTGELSNNGEPMRRFMQTFVLVPQTPKKYYVHNDIFRYQDEVYIDTSDTESEDQQPSNDTRVYYQQPNVENVTYTSSAPVQQQQQQQHEALPPRERNVVVRAAAAAEENTTPAVVNGHQQQQQQETPQINGVQENLVVEQLKVEEVKVEPEVRQEQAAPQEAPQAPVLQQQPTEPAKPSSWAKIIVNNPSAAPATGASTARPTTAVPTVPQQAAKPTAPPQQQQQQPQQQHQKENRGDNKPRANNNNNNNNDGSSNGRSNGTGPRGPANGNGNTRTSVQREHRQSINNPAEDENSKFSRHPDAHQIFVGNLHADMNETELQAFFNQYGTVVDVRINKNTKQQADRRLPNYGFIVFETKESVENLLRNSKASLSYKDERGNEHRLNIEEKRARQAGGGGNKQQQQHRGNRSSSNGSKGGRDNVRGERREGGTKRPNNNNNNPVNNTTNAANNPVNTGRKP